MTRHVVASAMVILILAQHTAYSQQVSGDRPRRFGVGVAGAESSVILFPISINRSFFVEPEVRLGRRTSTESSFFVPGDRPARGESTRTSTGAGFSIGSGIFAASWTGGFKTYYGARLGYVHSSDTTEIRQRFPGSSVFRKQLFSSEDNGVFGAPVLGGEYFLTERFSLGGEVQFRYTRVEGAFRPGGLWQGEPPDDDPGAMSTDSTYSTQGFFTARFYF